MATNLPPALVIGGISYTVSAHEDAAMLDGELLGDITYSRARIRIGDFLTAEKQVQVLFHELVHGLLVESELDRFFGEEGPEKEERVQLLAKILLRFVQDNDLSRFRK